MTQRGGRRLRRAVRLVAFLISFPILQSCAPASVGVDVEGKLDVLGPTVEFAAGPTGDWTAEGSFERGQIAVVSNEGVPALRVAAGKRAFVLARHTRAFLLATPYLSWAWNVEDQGRGIHPVRVVVGFWGGAPDSASRGGQPFVWLGRRLPRHDRSLAIGWADSALQRGNLDTPSAQRSHAPLYVVRGGRENANRWWLETVDLSQLYRGLWPNDDISRVEIAFVGVAAAPGAAVALLSGMRVSR